MVLLLLTLLITRLLLAQEPPSKVSRVERDVHLVCIFAKGHAQHGLAWKLHSVTHASCSFQHAQATVSVHFFLHVSAKLRGHAAQQNVLLFLLLSPVNPTAIPGLNLPQHP